MLSPHGHDLVLWVHVLAACIWIGGQATVAAVIPLLRGQAGMAALVGRRYQQIAWPAFALLAGTGIANAANAHITWGDLGSTAVGRTLVVKLGFVGLSGAAAAVHAFLQAPRRRDSGAAPGAAASAVLGSLSLLAAMVAALYGVVIAG